MGILLTTGRLHLRHFQPSDADALYALNNDPVVMRFLNGGTPTPRAVIDNEMLPHFMQYDVSQPGFGAFVVELRAEPRFLGWVSLRRTDRPAIAEVGYRMARVAWGNGYATEASRALLNYGFRHHNLRQIIATTYEENVGSRRVMEKLGMRWVRSFRYTPEEIAATATTHLEGEIDVWDGDDVEYAITREHWLGTV